MSRSDFVLNLMILGGALLEPVSCSFRVFRS